MAECLVKLNGINGNVEVSIPLGDCGLDVNQNYMEEQDLGAVQFKIQRDTTVLETHNSFNSEALDRSESVNATPAGYMEDPISKMKHNLNGADLMGGREDIQLNAPTNEGSFASNDEENNELWSDFAGYCKTSQFCGTFRELSSREKDDFAGKSFQEQSSKIPKGGFTNHHFPNQRHKSTNRRCDNGLNSSVSTTDACALKFSLLKSNISGNAEEEPPRGHNPGQSAAFVDNSFTDSAANWTTFERNGQLVEGTLQTDCGETEFSGFGTTLCPTNSPFSDNQEVLSAHSALKADTRNLLEKVFQDSFPSQPTKHSFEDIPTLEKFLEINGEESDANRAKTLTSPEFSSAWEVLQDLNKVYLRSSWNVSHARQRLLSTLGIDQNQKGVGQCDLQYLEDTTACCSDLEKISALPNVPPVSENGTKTLIQTRIPVTPLPRTGRSFTHRLETVFIQWLQMNGNRVREVSRIKRNSLFL
ncbi:uncharacterized protein LOC144507166 [Mustelus asterias]